MAMKDRISFLISEKKVSKTEFAKSIKVSQGFVSQMCSGASNPSERTIELICQQYGCDEVWLRTGAGEPFTPLSRSDELATIFEKVEIGTDEKSRLIRAMARIPDEAFPALLQFVQQLYQNFLEE